MTAAELKKTLLAEAKEYIENLTPASLGRPTSIRVLADICSVLDFLDHYHAEMFPVEPISGSNTSYLDLTVRS